MRQRIGSTGSLTFIVGRNGAGKSTLLRALARIASHVHTDASCFGAPLHGWKDREFSKRVAFLPQDRGAHQPELLAAEVVRLGRFAHGCSPEDSAIVEDCLTAVDAIHLAHRPMTELSGGERQRVWIAMALAQQTDAILLDEPTTFLDWQHQLELLSLLWRLNQERGVTVLAVVHDINLTLSIPARWMVLQQGNLLYHGPPAAFLAEWNLAEVFGMPLQVCERDGRLFLLPTDTQSQAHRPMHTDTQSAIVRCPVRPASTAASAHSETSSLFVEKAAADLVGSERHQGDPAADRLLQGVRDQIYYWPPSFQGFCGHLVVRDSGQEHIGGFHAGGSRRYTIELPGYPEEKWLKYQIEELIAHREATSVSHIASKAGVTFGDDDAVYGQRVDFVGDKMESWYRLKEGKITQIGRSYGKVRFIINIDEHCNCDGRFAAQAYTVFYFESATGRLSKTETYLDRYEKHAGVWLPVERRFSEATDAGLRTRQILFTNLHVIQMRTAA